MIPPDAVAFSVLISLTIAVLWFPPCTRQLRERLNVELHGTSSHLPLGVAWAPSLVISRTFSRMICFPILPAGTSPGYLGLP